MQYPYPTSNAFSFAGATSYTSVSQSGSILLNPKSLSPLKWFQQLSENANEVQCQSFCNKLLSADGGMQQFELDQFTIINTGTSLRIFPNDNPENLYIITQRFADFKADLSESMKRQTGNTVTKQDNLGLQPTITTYPKAVTTKPTINNTPPLTGATGTDTAPKKRTAAEIMAKYKSPYDPGPDASRKVRVESFTRFMRDQHKNVDTDFAALVRDLPAKLIDASSNGGFKVVRYKSFQVDTDNDRYKYTLQERGDFKKMEIWDHSNVASKLLCSISGLTFDDFEPDPLEHLKTGPIGAGAKPSVDPSAEKILADVRQTIAELKSKREGK